MTRTVLIALVGEFIRMLTNKEDLLERRLTDGSYSVVGKTVLPLLVLLVVNLATLSIFP